MAALEEDMYAATSRKPRDSRLQTWTKFHGNVMGESPVVPLSTEALLRISALFKVGRYKSFPGYLARAKELHISEGYTWTQQLDRLAKCCSRSVLRGLSGDADRSEPIDYDKATTVCMRVGYNTRFRKAAFCPFAIVCVGTLFLCREIELAGALATELNFRMDNTVLEIYLPASKMDQEAKGVVRTLECICDTCKFCPVHLLSDYVSRLKRVFVHEMRMDFDKLLLFPRADGTALSKEAVNNMLRQIVKKYGGRVDDEAGRSCISAHTFRITRARLLASWGLDATQ